MPRKIHAIKTDMSKAYDRVEWDFIYAQKLGFDPHWIKLMRVYFVCAISDFTEWSTAGPYNSASRFTSRGSFIPISFHYVY